MKKIITTVLTLIMVITFSGVAPCVEYTVGQKNKKFTVKKLKIKIGDTVHFTNEDNFFHNVYSLSDIKAFDLGSYPKGEFRSVLFDKTGRIPVECAIHPYMYMEIIVEK